MLAPAAVKPLGSSGGLSGARATRASRRTRRKKGGETFGRWDPPGARRGGGRQPASSLPPVLSMIERAPFSRLSPSVGCCVDCRTDVHLKPQSAVMVSTSPPRALAPKMPADNSPPATVSSSTSSSKGGGGSCRRKIAFHPTLGYAMPPVQPAKVERRNLRERNRVKQVNCGFDYLRSHIPGAAKQKKMSKVETLRHAVEYIQMLRKLVGGSSSRSAEEIEEFTKRVTLSAASPQPPPPITSPLAAIPTPSSTVSSEASTTPFEAVHFQYPSPLTPKTPSASSVPAEFHSYESGYDTASLYSAASTASSSFVTSPHSQQVNFCYPPPSHPQQQQHAESYSSYDYYGAEAVNSEEDELLDVIARWQDQED